MIRKMAVRELYEKYKDVILYIFFGVCTTIANVAAYWFLARLLGWGVMLSTVAAWSLAVLLAYLTNRKWVFGSGAKGVKEIAKEITSFFICRLVTGVIDWGCMYFFVGMLQWNDVMIKFGANVVVISLNYIASKLFIFKKDKGSI